MRTERDIQFSVATIRGGAKAFASYSAMASDILKAAYPEVVQYKPVEEAVQDDFLSSRTMLFLLLFNDLLVGYSSYSQLYVCSARKKEMEAFSWSDDEWTQVQKNTASAGWTVIHPEYQHRGGWSMIMDAFDASLVENPNYAYISRTVRKENGYDQIIARRYREHIVFQTDVWGYGSQTYFRIAIPNR